MIIHRREHRVLVQGLTGKQGSFWAEKMIACGTRVIGGVEDAPLRGCQKMRSAAGIDHADGRDRTQRRERQSHIAIARKCAEFDAP